MLLRLGIFTMALLGILMALILVALIWNADSHEPVIAYTQQGKGVFIRDFATDAEYNLIPLSHDINTLSFQISDKQKYAIFERPWGIGGRIMRMSINRRATTPIMYGVQPALSTDGRKLTYIDIGANSILGRGLSLYLIETTGAEDGEFLLENVWQADWLSASQIIFVPYNGTPYSPGFRILDVETGSISDLHEETRVFNEFDVSPDGKTLAYIHNSDLWLYDLVTQDTYQITENLIAAFPQWSPDGNQLLIMDASSTQSNTLRIVDRHGSTLYTFHTQNFATIFPFEWWLP